MTRPGVRERLQHRGKAAIFFGGLHPLVRSIIRHQGPTTCITCAGKRDGAGAQALAVLSTLLFAHDAGLRYVHTPFRRIQHNNQQEPGWVDRWEKFFNLGAGETSIDELTDARLEPVALDSILDFPIRRRLPFYVTSHCHEYANRFPDRYTGILPRVKAKYHSSRQHALPVHGNPSVLTIAVHARRGDVKAIGPTAGRHTGNEFICAMLRDTCEAARRNGLRTATHVYSEGEAADFGPLQDMDLTFHLNESPFEAMHNLIAADVLLMSKSTFSFVAALLSDGVKIFESFERTPFPHAPLSHWLTAGPDGAVDQSRLAIDLGHHLRTRDER